MAPTLLYVPPTTCSTLKARCIDIEYDTDEQQNDHLDRVNRTADLPDVPAGGMHSGGGAPGHSSGKGGHEPRTLGENKGLGAHKA